MEMTIGRAVRRIAIDYLRYGYVWCVVVEVPERKDPHIVERKLTRCYSITAHYTTRARRREKGLANVVLVRYKNTIIMLASDGEHPYFEKEKPRDLRITPLHIWGYSIGIKGDKPLVRVSNHRMKAIRKKADAIALHSKSKVEDLINNISPLHFPGIVRQKVTLCKRINLQRKKAKLRKVKVALPSRLN